MAMIERCYGISTGLGYLVGAGGSGFTEELDQIVEEAAHKLYEMYGVKITIRFNTDRKSGGASVLDGKLTDNVGITAALHNSKLLKMSNEEKMRLTDDKWEAYRRDLDTIVISTCLSADFLKAPSPYVCLNKEFRDVDNLEEAIHWLREGTNEKLRDYIEKLR